MNAGIRPLKTRYVLLILLLVPFVLRLPDLCGLFSSDPMYFSAAVGDGGHPHGGSPWIDPNVGFQAQALGKLSADEWLSGRIPWWNSYNGVGLPLAAEAQPASMFLPFVLLLHFRSGGVWIELLLQMLAGLCTYALLRKIQLSKLAAFTGALIFELNGTFAWHGAPIASPVAFLPMLLLGIELLRARILLRESGGWLLISAALAWSIYAGFPEVAYLDGLFAGVWTLARLNGMEKQQRLRFIGRMAFAAVTGLLLSLPLLVPFAEFVGRAYLGLHESALAHARPPWATLPLYLVPSLFGPIFSFNDSTHVVYATWSSIGGYFTALQLLLVVLGVLFCRRGLYVVLLAWIALCFAKSFDLRPVSDAINMIPMIKSAAFSRYAPPSWEFAAAVLIAMMIDGMQRQPAVSSRKIAWLSGIVIATIVGALCVGKEPVHALLQIRGYSHYFRVAVGWLVLSVGYAVLLLMWRRHRHHTARVLVMLVAMDACMAFALPILSGVSHLTAIEPGVTFLQKNLHQQRVYTLGPLSPNYGAFFGIAQINHNYLPVSSDWVSYVKNHLDTHADPIIFNGTFGHSDATAELVAHLHAYEALGVAYVIATPGSDPFAGSSSPAIDARTAEGKPLKLGDDQPVTVDWNIKPGAAERQVQAATVAIQTDAVPADGVLSVQVCNTQHFCSQGSRKLAGWTADNAPMRIGLDTPLLLPAAADGEQRVYVTIRQKQSTSPVALWRTRADATLRITVNDQPATLAPAVTLLDVPNAAMANVTLAYDGADMAIYRLPHPKPYFETGDASCMATPSSLSALDVDCQTSTYLLRREAFYPGWSASIDGRQATIERSQEIFQGLPLPAGRHRITYSYWPTHWMIILAGFLAGLLIWAIGALREIHRSGWLLTPRLDKTLSSVMPHR